MENIHVKESNFNNLTILNLSSSVEANLVNLWTRNIAKHRETPRKMGLFPDQRCMGENPHLSGPSSSIHKIATGGIHQIRMSFILADLLIWPPFRFWFPVFIPLSPLWAGRHSFDYPPPSFLFRQLHVRDWLGNRNGVRHQRHFNSCWDNIGCWWIEMGQRSHYWSQQL